MDGWYEWNADSGTKTPYLVTGDGPLTVAGLVDVDGEGELRATVVTTASAEPVAWLHDRMPRVLSDGEAGAWTDGGDQLRETASRVPDEVTRRVLTIRAVDRRVGNAAVDGPELIAGAQDTMGE